MTRAECCWLLGSWAAYFALHSVLASLRVKHWVARHCPRCVPGYRAAFNGLAVVLLLPPAYFTFAFRGEPLWAWEGPWAWVSLGLSAASVGGLVWSLRYYDGGEFLGLRQLRHRELRVEDQERLHISPLHRFVRHPWYSLGLVLIWTRDMDPAFLISALAVTLYFIVGSRLEERKLVVYHGDRYLQYRQRVPGLVPLPWRFLTRGEARRLADR